MPFAPRKLILPVVAALALGAAALVALPAGAAERAAPLPAPSISIPVPILPNVGTVSLDDFTLTYKAGPGVANKITVAGTLDEYFYIHDDVAFVRLVNDPERRCTQVDRHSVRCVGVATARVSLGDLNDSFTAEGYAPLRVSGGPGNDTLDAGNQARPVLLLGDEGDDLLVGGDGDDTLHAGPGVRQRTVGNDGLDTCTTPDRTGRILCEY